MDINEIQAQTRSMRALYVEDDNEVRQQTAKILRLFFHQVTDCGDAQEGIDKFKASKIDIVFTDINMPGINGLEMLERIKQIDPLVKTVIFSAYDESKFFTKAISIGVDGYILKPFTTEDLLSVLEKITQSIETKPAKLIYLSGDFVWDKQSSSLSKAGEIIKLTKNETSLLQLLLSSSGRIASGLEIENELFEDYGGYDDKRVRNIISRFHRKIGYKLIENIYSQGYRIKWR
ncbi:response regulator [uncultured Campylobacter sp.]|uniref:response regulator transcription factor n=1 Tax=uncultured Campylobacter sp. TaxID=218934 RepID=UPI00262CBDDC|nr:response regulator [uncultured Campylobacter sp.]